MLLCFKIGLTTVERNCKVFFFSGSHNDGMSCHLVANDGVTVVLEDLLVSRWIINVSFDFKLSGAPVEGAKISDLKDVCQKIVR